MAVSFSVGQSHSQTFPETFVNGQYDENLQEQRDEVLALQSIYNTDDDERLKVLSEVSEGKEGFFSLMLIVVPQPVSDEIKVEVVIPVVRQMMDEAAAAPKSETPPLFKKIKLNRTVSGQQWQGTIRIKYPSPIHLYVTLPASYPSENAPCVHLSCPWMSGEQVVIVNKMLEELWKEGCQMPILFTWVDWLENNVLSYLGITDHIVLKSFVGTSEEGDASPLNETAWEEELGETIASMIRYNHNQLDIEFCQTSHECNVCYDEKPGTQFFRMHDCPHHFCHDCMFAFCDMHVTQGTVEELRCPDTECKSLIPPYIVQAVLGPEEYQRWEQLLLQKTLDAMSDTVYCPRCSSLVIAEEEEELHLGHCTVCFFSFCTLCERTWHQGRGCETDEEILEQVQQRNSDRLSKAERDRFNELRKQLEEELAAKREMAKKTRRCPKCKAPIEKIGGCNKMTCKCGTHFCWLCGKGGIGYNHFSSSSCELFVIDTGGRLVAPAQQRIPDVVLRMHARMDVNPDIKRINCPSCKQMNLKVDNNNHIKCWNCKSNSCYMCGQRIVGSISGHFIGPCVQHSS